MMVVTPAIGAKPYFCAVRKVAAILFFSVILLAQTPVQQVLKLPILLEHFKEHRAANAISFLEFIKLHYFSGNPKDGDYDRDQQLPFRANDVILMSSTVVLPAQIVLAAPPLLFREKTYVLLKPTGLPSLHSFDIWQPPRSC